MSAVMRDMELDDEEVLDTIAPIPLPETPRYPYGLRICLTDAELKKLGLPEDEAEEGGIFHGHFLARITSVTKTDGPQGKSCRVEAQIESLSIEDEDRENKEAEE